jgi:hypothetical protein
LNVRFSLLIQAEDEAALMRGCHGLIATKSE